MEARHNVPRYLPPHAPLSTTPASTCRSSSSRAAGGQAAARGATSDAYARPSRTCNRMYWRLQPHVKEAAPVCNRDVRKALAHLVKG